MEGVSVAGQKLPLGECVREKYEQRNGQKCLYAVDSVGLLVVPRIRFLFILASS